jgi:hypothetical protein
MRNNCSIFISYSSKNKLIANEIDNDFKRIGIRLTRDERDLKDYEIISQFMKRVRECDYILMIISDAYLKSRNCMYEMLEFKKEKGYEKRVLPILLKDTFLPVIILKTMKEPNNITKNCYG